MIIAEGILPEIVAGCCAIQQISEMNDQGFWDQLGCCSVWTSFPAQKSMAREAVEQQDPLSQAVG